MASHCYFYIHYIATDIISHVIFYGVIFYLKIIEIMGNYDFSLIVMPEESILLQKRPLIFLF